jgi:hypothetical protein
MQEPIANGKNSIGRCKSNTEEEELTADIVHFSDFAADIAEQPVRRMKLMKKVLE